MQHTFYHSLLRISSLTLALVLLFESGLLSPVTKQLASDTHEYLASAIGMSAAVDPNGLNQITADLTAQKQRLDEREAALAEREIAIELNRGGTSDNSTTVFILSAILFILLVLILLNYVMDYLRSLEARRQKAVT